jgi:nucleoside-diphosphate kinase
MTPNITRANSARYRKEDRVGFERTLFIIKPDAVERRLIGRILAHVEGEGFRIVEARFAQLTREEAQTFYAEHQGKPFFGDLVEYMTSGPVLLTCLERESAIPHLRTVVGATDPAQAAPGTVRNLYGRSKQMNSVHASDSSASAEREVKLFFGVAALTR